MTMSPLHAADYLAITDFDPKKTKYSDVRGKIDELNAALEVSLTDYFPGFVKLSREHMTRCEVTLMEAIANAKPKKEATGKPPAKKAAPKKATKPSPAKRGAYKR